MSEAELRMHRCCFTGHRPDKMTLGEKEIKPMLWNNVNKVDSKKRKNYTDINIASFWLGVRPLLCE